MQEQFLDLYVTSWKLTGIIKYQTHNLTYLPISLHCTPSFQMLGLAHWCTILYVNQYKTELRGSRNFKTLLDSRRSLIQTREKREWNQNCCHMELQKTLIQEEEISNTDSATAHFSNRKDEIQKELPNVNANFDSQANTNLRDRQKGCNMMWVGIGRP